MADVGCRGYRTHKDQSTVGYEFSDFLRLSRWLSSSMRTSSFK